MKLKIIESYLVIHFPYILLKIIFSLFDGFFVWQKRRQMVNKRNKNEDFLFRFLFEIKKKL